MRTLLFALFLALGAAAAIVAVIHAGAGEDRPDIFGREQVSIAAVSATPTFAGADTEINRMGNSISQWQTEIAIAAPWRGARR